MGATKEYYLKLQEQFYNELPDNEKSYLNTLGLQVKQLPTDEDLNDEQIKSFKIERSKLYHKEQEYLFKKRNNIT